MARPWKHPRTGIFWLRKRVPAAMRAIVGKAEELRSLRTRDPEEAKQLHAAAMVALDDKWRQLRADGAAEKAPEPKPLTEREAHQDAQSMFDFWLGQHRDNPSRQTFWPPSLYDKLWNSPSALLDALSLTGEARLQAIGDARRVRKLEAWCLEQADDHADVKGWKLDAESRQLLAQAIAAAVQRASLRLASEAKGERFEQNVAPAPAETDRVSASPTQSSTPVPIDGLMTDWWREAQAAGRKLSTFESYRNTISGFRAFLGHNDAARIKPEDVVRFKDHRLTTPSRRLGKPPSAKTVKDSDLSALKAIFGWAVANHKLPKNPAAGVTIKLGKKRLLRPKGFTDEEACALLAAALAHDATAGRTAAAKRWVPWLCAFTGARVGEIAQLRKEDMTQIDGNWVIRITPEANTVKNDEARDVVLHRQLVDQGFPEFVAKADDGHLFLRPSATGDIRGPWRSLKNRLAEAARAIVPDRGVAPNHGWRHRFMTIGMGVGIEHRVLDAIEGHAPRHEGGKYGEVTLSTIAAAVAKLPSVNLGQTCGG